MSFIGNNIKQNTVTFTPQSADPVNPAEGMQFRSDGTSREEGMWEYKNGEWQKLGSGSGAALNFIDDNSATFEGSVGEWTTTSFRKTIIGSSSAVDSLSITSHGMSTGDEVIYREGSTPIVGLTDGDTYYVINVDPDEVQLSSTPFGSALNLSTNGGDGILAPANPVGVESASTALSLILDDTDPLNGSRSLLMQKNDTLSGESEAFSLVIPVPEGYHNRNLVLEFIKNTVGTNNYADNNYEVYVKDDSGNFQFLSGTNIGLLNNNENFRGFINAQTPASLELLVYVKTTNTDVMYVRADDFILAPAVPTSIQFNLAAAKAAKTATQSIPSQAAGADTKVTFDSSLDYNLGSAVTWDSANSRMVFTRPAFGYAQATIEFATNATGFRRGLIKLNGTVISRDSRSSATASAVTNAVADTLPRQFNAGDYVEFFVTQNSGGNLDITGTNINEFIFQETRSYGSVEALASNSSLEVLTAVSNTVTPSASLIFPAHTGNSVILKAGRTYDVTGFTDFAQSGLANYSILTVGIYAANGDNGGSYPALLSSLSTIQVLSEPDGSAGRLSEHAYATTITERFSSPTFTIRALSDTQVYVVPFVSLSTPANGRVTSYITAKEIPFSNTALIGIPDVELHLDTGNGYGSTGTFIRRFSNVNKNTLGSFATYVDSATNGMSVTINVKGQYQISYEDVRSSANLAGAGISVNASNISSPLSALNYADGKRGVLFQQSASTGRGAAITRVLNLNPGDVVRAHAISNDGASTDNVAFSLTFLGFVK
jgi:hypothetical protein